MMGRQPSGHAYDSLDAVRKDLHLLLLDPLLFLFDCDTMSLLFKEHIFYGRERGLSLITDAFC